MRRSCEISTVFLTLTMAATMVLASLSPTIAFAQPRTLKLSGDQDVFMLDELGAVIADAENGPRILMVLPKEQRTEAYRDVDLREGDTILMVNGKKITGARQLKELYEGLDIGDDLKLGIRRGKELLIESLAKADPDDLPAQMMIIKGGEGSDGVATVMAAVGLILKAVDGKVVIDEVLPGMNDKFTGGMPQKGDVIVKLQETSITQPGQISEIYAKLKTNDQVRLTLDRQGTEVSIGFAKQECTGNKPLIIKK
jgi:S1-C subfamily serine protease